MSRPGPQNYGIEPGASLTFDEKEVDGLAGSRYWPKMGCDEKGSAVLASLTKNAPGTTAPWAAVEVHSNSASGPGGCVNQAAETINTPDYSSCAPPIDTKFEVKSLKFFLCLYYMDLCASVHIL